MTWRKSPEALVQTFNHVVPIAPHVERRAMFGYPAAFVNGNMFCGLHQDDLVMRLSEDDRAELLAQTGARTFEPMPGRPMREYVVPPLGMLVDVAELRRWLARALAYVATLPGKGKKGAPGKKAATKAPVAKKSVTTSATKAKPKAAPKKLAATKNKTKGAAKPSKALSPKRAAAKK